MDTLLHMNCCFVTWNSKSIVAKIDTSHFYGFVREKCQLMNHYIFYTMIYG